MNGQTRRRERTRAALVGAAQELLAEGRLQASIEEITKRAGVGFGSFFNHFESKDALFSEAVLRTLDVFTDGIRVAVADLTDPAEIFARSFRLTGRLARARPEVLAPLLNHGTDLLVLDRGLRQAALADIRAGVATGRFVALDPEILVMTVAGAMLGLIRHVSRDPAAVSEAHIDAIAAAVLRLLGVDVAEAAAIVGRPLPGTEA